MHGKEKVIAPLLEKHLGVETIVPQQFNTDQFGTFTREVKRPGDQLQTAQAKVYAAMKQEGVDLGISSEGSFGMHPSIPFVQSNLELLLFVDQKNDYEIRGYHRTSETNISGKYITSDVEALTFAQDIGFPEQGVIVRRSENEALDIHKNVETEADLRAIVHQMLSDPSTDRLFVETDLRAHRNPTRMKAIGKAMEDLIQNMLSFCPQCQAPGFVVVDFEKGLPCSLCHRPTDFPLNDLYWCNQCHYKEKKPVTKYGETVSPQYCGYCNP